jgi:hypothetical protein
MLRDAWNEYRGWARRARHLRGAVLWWNRSAFGSAMAAAIFGTIAVTFNSDNIMGKAFSLIGALAAAVAPFLGHRIFDIRREASALRARAIAEATKSECFRFAAPQ